MTSAAATSLVYINVIEDVVSKVREDFVSSGGSGQAVLNELQGLWEMKMMEAGVIVGLIQRGPIPTTNPEGPMAPVHDLNVPYEGTEEYETPTADLLFPPTPLETPVQTPFPRSGQTPLPGTAQTPLPGTVGGSLYNIPTGGTPFNPGEYSNDYGGASDTKPGRPSQFMEPPLSWLHQRLPFDVNLASDDGHEEAGMRSSRLLVTQDFLAISSGKRKRDDLAPEYRNGNIPQQDGAGDSISDEQKYSGGEENLDISTLANASNLDFLLMYGEKRKRDDLTSQYPYIHISKQDEAGDAISDEHKAGKETTCANQEFARVTGSSSQIPQVDGPISDPYADVLSTPKIYNYQGSVNEDYNIVNTPAPDDLQEAASAPLQNDAVDDEDDEPLNENDDIDDDLEEVNQGEDLNIQHLVLCQFEKVTRTKTKWKCFLKDGIMHLNDNDIIFNKAYGDLEF